MSSGQRDLAVLDPTCLPSGESVAGKKEYRIITRVKNNLLLSVIEKAGYRSITEFAKKADISVTALCDIISFRQSPLNKNGDWRPIIHSVCEVLNKMPSQLFTERQMQIKGATAQIAEVSEAEAVWALEHSGDGDPQQLLETKELYTALRATLDMLTPMEKEVVVLYYGLDGLAHCLKEIAEKFDISKTRVQHIHDKALRKLKHPMRIRNIKETM